METFKDATGTTRALTLTIGKSRRGAKALGVDFIDGDPTKIANDLLIKTTLQLDLVWVCLDEKDGMTQEEFEEKCLDGEAFDRSRLALVAEIGNFIQSVRPEFVEIFNEAILLIRTQITKSADRAVSLFRSTEVQEGFLQASADAEMKAKKKIEKLFLELQADLE